MILVVVSFLMFFSYCVEAGVNDYVHRREDTTPIWIDVNDLITTSNENMNTGKYRIHKQDTLKRLIWKNYWEVSLTWQFSWEESMRMAAEYGNSLEVCYRFFSRQDHGIFNIYPMKSDPFGIWFIDVSRKETFALSSKDEGQWLPTKVKVVPYMNGRDNDMFLLLEAEGGEEDLQEFKVVLQIPFGYNGGNKKLEGNGNSTKQGAVFHLELALCTPVETEDKGSKRKNICGKLFPCGSSVKQKQHWKQEIGGTFIFGQTST